MGVIARSLHTIWQLPENDANYFGRWRQIKRFTQYHCRDQFPNIWQKRFWEQTIRDDVDFAQHLDDLHFNPVKHGYVDQVINWEYSSFHGMRAVALIPQIAGGGDEFEIAYDE